MKTEKQHYDFTFSRTVKHRKKAKSFLNKVRTEKNERIKQRYIESFLFYSELARDFSRMANASFKRMNKKKISNT